MASSSDQPPKRQRLDAGSSVVRTGLPLKPQVACHGLSRHLVARELHKHDDEHTPYGPLYQTLALKNVDDTVSEVQVLNPFALLWTTASASEHAADFFSKHLGGRTSKLAFYCDGVKPGNALRPDVGRSFEAIYWSFVELPSWFRNRVQVGWLLFAFIETRVVQKVSGGMAAVAKQVIEHFFPRESGKFHFSATGVLLPCRGREVQIRAAFGCWLADEKAFKEIVSCKGSSGTKPCVCCKNVVNRTSPADSEYLVHISCPDVGKFDRQTFESLNYMASDLAAKREMCCREQTSACLSSATGWSTPRTPSYLTRCLAT
jgi:hypothetical protein